MNNGQKPKRIRIPLDEAKRLYDEDNVTVLDVVDTESYSELSYKVEGAVRINPEDFKEKYTQLPKDRLILAYCT